MPDRGMILVDDSTVPARITVKGGLDVFNAGHFREAVGHLMAAGRRRFVIECRDCRRMDSTGLGTLLIMATRLKEMGPETRFLLNHVPPRGLDLIRKLGLGPFLELGEEEVNYQPREIDPPGE